MKSKSPYWAITVGGYGTFIFQGTEIEAEAMRRHKASWEKAVARKRPPTQQEIEKHIATLPCEGCASESTGFDPEGIPLCNECAKE